MSDSKRAGWRKLDNAALAFPAVTGKSDTRVFRFYAQLKEPVDPEVLQQALDQTMEVYPLFRAVLRKGAFWYYLEQRDIRPMVKLEQGTPCNKIFIPDKKNLLFEVTYYENRINFQVFHGLTDGTGAMHFITELVGAYLRLAHPEENLPLIPRQEEITESDQTEDSFSQYYNNKQPKQKGNKPTAWQIKGSKVAQNEMAIMEVSLSVKETLAKARSYGVSITVLLTAAMLCAIGEEIPVGERRKDIGLMVPVNLRNYFPSQSMTNFFGWIEVRYRYQEDTKFEQVLQSVKEQFEKELVKEKIAMKMNELVGLEKNPFLRAVPLEIKKYFLLAGATLGGKSLTAVFSNIGVIHMPDEYKEYIHHFGIFTSTGKLQLCTCSFEDELVLGYTSKFRSNNIERNLLRILKDQEELTIHKMENQFPDRDKTEQATDRRAFQIFTFTCIAIAILCGMINFLLAKQLDWSLCVAGGVACTWVITTVAFVKRRNILKNTMWQLVIISILCMLWDRFTGWRGWSVEMVMPLATLAVLAAMPFMIMIAKLEPAEYLFYLILAAAFGLIPIILLWVGVVQFPYFAVICSCVCFLFLLGLFIFRGKETLYEFEKKFRV